MARTPAHPPLRHYVLEEIRRQIISGRLAPGARIYEEEIASELGVSRNPVREAVQALDGEGFIEIEPRRGARVAVISPTRVRELFEVREVLEGLVASLAARHRTAEQLAELQSLVDAGFGAAATGDLVRLPPLNTRFHQLLAATARNQLLAESIERLGHLIEWIYAQRIAERAPQSWNEHRSIVAAVADRDEVRAERAARTHIAQARDAYATITDV